MVYQTNFIKCSFHVYRMTIRNSIRALKEGAIFASNIFLYCIPHASFKVLYFFMSILLEHV